MFWQLEFFKIKFFNEPLEKIFAPRSEHVLYGVTGKEEREMIQGCVFCLIQLCFAFFSSAALPEFEAIRMRYVAGITLVLIRESVS